jgi:DNA-binding MarR family transcriptional regulator
VRAKDEFNSFRMNNGLTVDLYCARVALLGSRLAPGVDDMSVHSIIGSTDEDSAVSLSQLSEDVNRIAARLARLSTGTSLSAVRAANMDLAPPALRSEAIKRILKARRMREDYFSTDLFADPAWDMLLELLLAELSRYRVPVSSLCLAAQVPPTTALRWIGLMADAGLVRRRPDPDDRRRVFVELTSTASAAMHGYFDSLHNEAAHP